MNKGMPSENGGPGEGGSIGAWLRIFRINLLPVFLMPLFAGFLAGGGSLFSLYGLSLFLWGILAFSFTFGHNSLEDAVSGYDVGVKKPETHPLISGEVSVGAARKLIHSGLVAVALLAIFLAHHGTGEAFLSVSSFLVFAVTGYTYNGTSKFTSWSFVPISCSFASLLFFGYFLSTENPTFTVYLLALFVFLTIWFETSFEGALKDIGCGESSALRELGTRADWGKIEWGASRVYGAGVKLAGLSVITYTILWRVLTPYTALAWGFFSLVSLVVVYGLMTTEFWDRKRVLVLTGVEELACFSLLLVAVPPVSGWLPVAFLLAFSLLWVPLLSSILYGVPVWSVMGDHLTGRWR